MKRWFILLLIVSLMVVGIAGCGGDSNGVEEADEENGGEAIGPDPDDDEDVGRFYNFDTVLDLASEFKELGWSYMGETVDYLFEGRDTVNGVSAEYIIVKTGGVDFDIWMADDGKIVKAVVDGQELPPEAAHSAQYMFGLLEVFIDEQEWDRKWASGEDTTLTRDLGAGPVQITRYDWRITGMPVYIQVDVAEIAGRNLMIRLWQYAQDDTPISGWELHRVIPR